MGSWLTGITLPTCGIMRSKDVLRIFKQLFRYTGNTDKLVILWLVQMGYRLVKIAFATYIISQRQTFRFPIFIAPFIKIHKINL